MFVFKRFSKPLFKTCYKNITLCSNSYRLADVNMEHKQQNLTDLKNSGIYTNEILHGIENKKNNFFTLIRYNQCKDYFIEDFVLYLYNNHLKISNEYVTYVLKQIIKAKNFESLNTKQYEHLIELCILYHIRDYSVFQQFEKLYRKDKDMISPYFFSYFLVYLDELDWKTNDEYFGEIMSKTLVSSLHKMNFNNFAINLKSLSKFKFSETYAWKGLEHEIMNKFKNLFKQISLERIAFAYSNIDLPDTQLWMFMKNFIVNNLDNRLVSAARNRALPYLGSLIIRKGYYDKDFNKLINDLLMRFNHVSADDLEKYIQIIDNLQHYHQKKDEFMLIKMNKMLQERLKKDKPIEIYIYLSELVKTGLIKEVKFTSIDDATIHKIGNIDTTYFRCIDLYHHLSKYDQRILKFANKLCEISHKAHIELDELIPIVIYLAKYKNDSSNKFYQLMVDDCNKILERNDLSYNVKGILLISQYRLDMLKTKKSKENMDNFIKSYVLDKSKNNSFVAENGDDKLIYFIIRNILYKEDIPESLIDIDNTELFKAYRDIGNLSIKEMNEMFNCKFYSSIYENFFKN